MRNRKKEFFGLLESSSCNKNKAAEECVRHFALHILQPVLFLLVSFSWGISSAKLRWLGNFIFLDITFLILSEESLLSAIKFGCIVVCQCSSFFHFVFHLYCCSFYQNRTPIVGNNASKLVFGFSFFYFFYFLLSYLLSNM